MPELPEVEITRQRLRPLVVGQRIASVTCTRPSYFFLTPPTELARALRGAQVKDLERQGKYLVMSLNRGQRLLLHLGMTGQLFFAGSRSPRLLTLASHTDATEAFEPDSHTHLQMHFRGAAPTLFFRDVRKFGKVALLSAGQSDPRLDKLGPDALEATGRTLHTASRKRRIPIKTLLLDQGVLAGVGNIYADEALYRSRLRPMTPAADLTLRQCNQLAKDVIFVLRRSIETGGSSISDFVAPDGSDGQYQNERQVYARTGEPCSRCATPIERIVLAQRGTHYCPKCQR